MSEPTTLTEVLAEFKRRYGPSLPGDGKETICTGDSFGVPGKKSAELDESSSVQSEKPCCDPHGRPNRQHVAHNINALRNDEVRSGAEVVESPPVQNLSAPDRNYTAAEATPRGVETFGDSPIPESVLELKIALGLALIENVIMKKRLEALAEAELLKP